MSTPMTDDEIVRRVRAELDDLVADVPAAPSTAAPVAPPTSESPDRRWLALGVAAVTVAVVISGLLVLANRDANEATTDAPPPTAPGTRPATVPATSVPATPPHTSAPSATTVPAPAFTELETIAMVLENDQHGPQLCLGEVSDSLPPQCSGPDLEGWSWDAIDVEQSRDGTTWADAYLSGTWDPAAQVFTVTSARLPTDDDRQRFFDSSPMPDYSVPCAEPEGGWPARNQEWPGEQIHMLDGYAGSWVDESQQVMTVKFTGDLAAAETAVRQYYADPVCIVGAEHSEAELVGISNQLMSMSSIQFLWSAVYADATGEWVEVGVIAPDPERQAAFDAEWGPGVVRLVPRLRPI